MRKGALRCGAHPIGLPAVVVDELYYGAFKSQRVNQNVARVDALQFPVLELDHDDARRAGEVRAAGQTGSIKNRQK